jgi:hypothetical protein
MTGALGELSRRDARLMPECDPAMTKIVQRVVRHLRVSARALHRLVDLDSVAS